MAAMPDSPTLADPAAVRRPLVGRVLRIAFGIGISLLFAWLTLRQVSFADVRAAFLAADVGLLGWALLAVVAGYALRITRWWAMLRCLAPSVSWSGSGRVYLSSIALNNLLPLRAGDVYRLFAWRGQGGPSVARITGTLLVERLLDLAVLLGLFFLVLPRIPVNTVPQSLVTMAAWLSGAAALAVVAVIVFALAGRRWVHAIAQRPAVASSGLLSRALGFMLKIGDSVLELGALRTVALLIGLSVLSWLCEGLVFLAVAKACHLEVGLIAALFALSLATISTLIPSSPGYIGTFHYFALLAIQAFGVSATAGAAFAVLVHLALWLPTTLAGVAMLGRRAAGMRT
jgi:uncharacterized protein (TIRG00374 family)